MPKSRNRKIKKKNKVRASYKVSTELVVLTRPIKGEIALNIIVIAMMTAIAGTVVYMSTKLEKQQDKISEVKSSISEKQNANTTKFINYMNNRHR